MSSSRSSEQDALIVESDAYSPASLVEHGLNCIEQGHYAEGAAFFRLARERFFPGEAQLADSLDALNKAAADYLQAQQTLHEASKRFAESDAERQAQIEALKKLLAALVEDILPTSSAGAQPRKHSRGNQSLRLLPSPPVLAT